MRIIFIDNCSGFVWGEGTLPDGGTINAEALETEALVLDAIIDQSSALTRTYSGTTSKNALAANQTGYLIYADQAGQIGEIADGQDQELIEAVTSKCTQIGCVEIGTC